MLALTPNMLMQVVPENAHQISFEEIIKITILCINHCTMAVLIDL